MTEFSLAHSYTFRWEDARQRVASKRLASRSFWFVVIGLEIVMILGLLGAYSFIVNDRVRFETESRALSLAIPETQETLDSLSITLAEKRSPGELEHVAKALGYVVPVDPLYLEL